MLSPSEPDPTLTPAFDPSDAPADQAAGTVSPPVAPADEPADPAAGTAAPSSGPTVGSPGTPGTTAAPTGATGQADAVDTPAGPTEQAASPRDPARGRQPLDRWAGGAPSSRDQMLAVGRDFGVPLLLLLALGTYLLFQRRLDRGAMPMTGTLHPVDGSSGDERDVRL